MATNAFLPFATANGANVATAADYSANSGYAGGYQAGVATSKFLNFTWRQSSFMTAAIGQLIADYGNINAVDDGVIANLEASLVAGIGGVAVGRLINVQVFGASGTFTYTPTAGTKSQLVMIQGGGGAGGGAATTGAGQISAGAGGAGGGYVMHRFSTPATGSVVVGSAGAPVAGAAGGAGGNSTFGGLTATGGTGGTSGGAASTSSNPVFLGGSTGGVGTGGNILNAAGGFGQYATYTTGAISGFGGASNSGAGPGGVSTSAGGTTATSRGAGGGGAALQNSSAAAAGGFGGVGIIIIWEYA